jgi:WD40 repeat protein
MTNLVAFRGHENPVWDVKWSPVGIYFATASRDRTARLWSTDRTSCLRIYAGHLSDVDVRLSSYMLFSDSHWLGSVFSSTQIRFTLLRVRAIGQPGYGMFSADPVCVS